MGDLKEEDVGIVAFVRADMGGFSGTIKHRFRDFIVREIEAGGQDCDADLRVVRLTDVSVPSCVAAPSSASTSGRNTRKDLIELIGLEAMDGLNQVLDESKSEVTLNPIESKDGRSFVHQAIREIFEGELETNTKILDDEKRVIIVSRKGTSARSEHERKRRRGGQGAGASKRARTVWPGGTKKFVKFVLAKENMDSSVVVSHLCRELSVPQKTFGFAGTKDKRAVTFQHMTAQKVDPGRLAGAIASLQKKRPNQPLQFALGNFEFVEQEMKLGDHAGNQFEVVFREVEVDSLGKPGEGTEEGRQAKQQVEDAVASWKEYGFLNYFGMQRFGSYGLPTHAIGKLVLQGKFKEVVDLLCAPSRRQNNVDEALKEFRETGEVDTRLKSARGEYLAARSIALNLEAVRRREGKSPCSIDAYDAKEYISSFEAIPKHLRSLYIHAYQSFIFNQMVSKRVELYGADKVVVGDLVRKGDEFEMEHATAEDIDAGKWTMEDVLLPMFGSKTKLYPKTEINRDLCASLLKNDDVYIDQMLQHAKKSAPSGDYRKILIKPRGVEHSWIHYGDESKDADFISTELESVTERSDVKVPVETSWSLNRSRAAFAVRFYLRTSSYATMGFRELTKTPTHLEAIQTKQS